MDIKYREDDHIAIEGIWRELDKLHEILNRNNIKMSIEDLELCKAWLTSFINAEMNLRIGGYIPGCKRVSAKEAGEAVSRGLKKMLAKNWNL